MQALIVHDDHSEVQRLRGLLGRHGFQTAACTDQAGGLDQMRRMPVDLLVLKQVIGGRHTTSVALAGELRNPALATVLLTERSRQDAVELFELVPSLFAILGPRPEETLLSTLAVQAVEAKVPPVLVLTPSVRVAAEPPPEPALPAPAQTSGPAAPGPQRSLRGGFASRRRHAA